MSVKLKSAPKTDRKPTSINDKAIVTNFRDWHDKTLLEVNAILGANVNDYGSAMAVGGNFPVFVIDTKDYLLTVPFSKGANINTLEQAKELLGLESTTEWCFRVGNKQDLDAEGNPKPGEDIKPTGDMYISFGRPKGLAIEGYSSMVEPEATTAGKVNG